MKSTKCANYHVHVFMVVFSYRLQPMTPQARGPAKRCSNSFGGRNEYNILNILHC